MSHPDLVRYHVTADPSMLRPYAWGEPDARPPEERDPERTQQHLDLVHRCWTDVLAGRPVPEALPPRLATALDGMRAAADWVARHPEHPALMALMEQLGQPPLCLLLGDRIAWQDQERSDLYLSGMPGGLHVEESAGTVPEDAQDDARNVSGLLGVSRSGDARYGLSWLEVVVWPLPHAVVGRMIVGAQ